MLQIKSDTQVTRPDLLSVLIPKPSNCTCKLDAPDAGCAVHAFGVEPKYEDRVHDPDKDGPLCMVVVLDYNTGLWHIFEGTVDVREHRFQVFTAVTAFPANQRDFDRIPDQVLRFTISAAKAKGLSVWMP